MLKYFTEAGRLVARAAFSETRVFRSRDINLHAPSTAIALPGGKKGRRGEVNPSQNAKKYAIYSARPDCRYRINSGNGFSRANTAR